MKVPTIHSNGTSREALEKQILDAGIAVRVAIEKLCEAEPHSRDYYVQPTGAFAYAAAEFKSRLERLQSVYTELTELYEAVINVNATEVA